MPDCMISTYMAQKTFVFATSTYAEPVACGFILVFRTVKSQMCRAKVSNQTTDTQVATYLVMNVS